TLRGQNPSSPFRAGRAGGANGKRRPVPLGSAGPPRTLEFPIDPVTFPPGGGGGTEPDTPPPPARRRRWPVVVASLVAVLVVVAGIVRLPYYVLSPGSATAVEPLIKVQGATSYQHPGRILFTTVSLAGDVNAYALLHGWLSATDEVVSRKAITGGTPTKTYNQENIQAMTDSKTAATKVALERLGYTVPAHGDGAQIVQVIPQGAADGLLKAGDVITAVDGAPVHFDEQSVNAVRAHKPGDVITFTVSRDGATQSVPVKAG